MPSSLPLEASASPIPTAVRAGRRLALLSPCLGAIGILRLVLRILLVRDYERGLERSMRRDSCSCDEGVMGSVGCLVMGSRFLMGMETGVFCYLGGMKNDLMVVALRARPWRLMMHTEREILLPAGEETCFFLIC